MSPHSVATKKMYKNMLSVNRFYRNRGWCTNVFCTYLFSNMLVKEMNKSPNFFWYIVCICLRFYSRIKAIHLTYNKHTNETMILKFSSRTKNPVFLKCLRYTPEKFSCFSCIVWSSLCFWNSMYRFLSPLIVLVPQDLNLTLYASSRNISSIW